MPIWFRFVSFLFKGLSVIATDVDSLFSCLPSCFHLYLLILIVVFFNTIVCWMEERGHHTVWKSNWLIILCESTILSLWFGNINISIILILWLPSFHSILVFPKLMSYLRGTNPSFAHDKIFSVPFWGMQDLLGSLSCALIKLNFLILSDVNHLSLQIIILLQ